MSVSQTRSAGEHPLVGYRFKFKRIKCASVPWACEGKGRAMALTPHSRMLIWEGLQDPPESDVLRSGKGEFVCFMSLCLCLAGEISTLVGAKLHGFEKKKRGFHLPLIWGR